MKRIVDWLLTINLIIVTAVGVYLWWSGQIVVQYGNVQPSTLSPVPTERSALFASTMRGAVDETLGQPKEGYTPAQFLAVFPGLVATDFENAEASIGKYVVVEGQLVHVIPPDTPLHSAATAITSRGLATVLQNIATRASIDLTADGTITDVMNVISKK